MIDDGNQIKNKDVDLLLIGVILLLFKDDIKINLLVEVIKSWVKMLMCYYDLVSIYFDDEVCMFNICIDIIFFGLMVVVIGFQLLYNDQCSVVVLLVDSLCGNELLINVFNDSGKWVVMFGLVVVICEFGVNSLWVGDIYYVGYLFWFECIWFVFFNYLILLVIFVVISIVLLVWVLWCMLCIISCCCFSLDDE